ncbi:MAG: hypothetical protein JNL28_16695 [Planctomycetes bacterium]|nr:hypothetical protein [Planctomycetota bacterium]
MYLRDAHRRPRHAQRGTAIMPALIVVIMVATLSMIYIQVSLAKNKEQRVSVDSKRAFYMAEAGLAEGFNGLCLGKSGNVASEDTPAVFGSGLFWTVATELGGGRVALQATGLCGAGRATLALTCEREPDTIGALGFFGDQNITVESGALIDSYDSRLGPYATQALLAPLSAGAKVGGNSDINVTGTLLAPTKIYGDVKPGPAGTLFRSGSTTVIGSTAPNVARVTFPAVRVPTIVETGDLAVNSGTAKSITAGTHGIGTLRASNNSTVILNGPAVIVTRRLVIEPGSTLKINSTDGPVKLFVTEGMKFASGSTFATTSSDPRGITIQVSATADTDLDRDGITDPPITLAATGEYHGSIYAPGAAVGIQRGFSVFGAVVAQTLAIRNGGQLHFDRSLSGSADAAAGTPRLLGWHIVELPDVGIVKLRYDALADLIRQGITPLKPRDAHFDIGVTPN